MSLTPEDAAAAMRTAMENRCDHCMKPRATDADWTGYEGGQGTHLCWSEWPSTCPEPAGDFYGFLAEQVAALVAVREAAAVQTVVGLIDAQLRIGSQGVDAETILGELRRQVIDSAALRQGQP